MKDLLMFVVWGANCLGAAIVIVDRLTPAQWIFNPWWFVIFGVGLAMHVKYGKRLGLLEGL